MQTMDSARVHRGIRYFYYEHALGSRLESWWREEILPIVPAHLRAFFTELFRYELLTLPIPEDSELAAGLKMVYVDEKEYFQREVEGFHFDMSALLRAIEVGEPCDLAEGPPRTETFYYRVGFADYIDSHELVMLYSGRCAAELNEKAPVNADHPYFDASFDQLLEEQLTQ